MAISFFTEGVSFQLAKPQKTKSWILSTLKKEKKKLHSVTYIFCPDSFLLDLNIRFLRHKTLTDILTFDQSEGASSIRGEIYISIERVTENAVQFERTFDDELHRVIIHGMLHLCGYKDKTPLEKALMRKKEEAYLSLR